MMQHGGAASGGLEKRTDGCDQSASWRRKMGGERARHVQATLETGWRRRSGQRKANGSRRGFPIAADIAPFPQGR